jgi:hypothetical protein
VKPAQKTNRTTAQNVTVEHDVDKRLVQSALGPFHADDIGFHPIAS